MDHLGASQAAVWGDPEESAGINCRPTTLISLRRLDGVRSACLDQLETAK